MDRNMRSFPTFRSWAEQGIGAGAAAGILFLSTPAFAKHENPLFGYTHLLPSPYTMKAGRLVIGTDAALGLTDFLQLSTNLIYDFYKVFNLTAKVSLIDYPQFAMGLTFGWETYNYKDVATTNPDLQVTSLLPGIITAFEIFPDVALFSGGNLNYTSTELVTSSVQTSGYVTGARLETDLSWAYNPRRKDMGNVLSGGISYDLTYRLLGFGVGHHWPGFHVGIHYYPNASQYKVQPILAGSAAVQF